MVSLELFICLYEISFCIRISFYIDAAIQDNLLYSWPALGIFDCIHSQSILLLTLRKCLFVLPSRSLLALVESQDLFINTI